MSNTLSTAKSSVDHSLASEAYTKAFRIDEARDELKSAMYDMHQVGREAGVESDLYLLVAHIQDRAFDALVAYERELAKCVVMTKVD